MIKTSMNPTEWALLITLSLLWGGSFFFAELALEGLPPLSVVFARVAIGALALLALARAAGLALPRGARLWRAFFVMGALNNLIPFTLIVWGQTEITGGLAAILNATTPLFTVALAHALTRDERMTPAKGAGTVVGFLGVTIMIGPQAIDGDRLFLLAQIAVLGAALSYAGAGLYGRRFRQVPPLIAAAGQVTAASVMLCPLALLVDRPWTLAPPGAVVLGALVALGLLCTAAAYVIYFRILATAGATNLLLVTFLIPVSAILLGALLLGERLSPGQAAGMGLIALGLGAIDGRIPAWILGRVLGRNPPAPRLRRAKGRPARARR
ncbi:MAG: DMT family transporter [Kiloniellales bacterium]|nr:DMT family transporter [Kiloniellales bacterium]